MSTETERWRLLNAGENLHPGDETYNPHLREWQPVDPFLTDNAAELGDTDYHWCHRRPMTPAECNAEELMESIQKYFVALDTGGDSEEGHALMAMHKALCKAMGRELPVEAQILDAILNPE